MREFKIRVQRAAKEPNLQFDVYEYSEIFVIK